MKGIVFKEDEFIPLVKEENILKRIINLTLEEFPSHKKSLIKNINSHSPEDFKILKKLLNNISLLISDEIDDYIKSYKWFCQEILKDQICFLKTNKYRRTNFNDVYKDIYDNQSYMKKYIRGLLLSQILWNNHSKSFINYTRFIESQKTNYRLLEIGPGHGLYLAAALENKNCKHVSGWDISGESINQTNSSIQKIKIADKVSLEQINILDDIEKIHIGRYRIIVMVEVLECIDNTNKVLKNIKYLLENNGILYLNFPINSPAPDNILHLKNISEVENILKNQGFSILSTASYPANGYDLNQAIKMKSTISCVVIAKK
ncbi:class I SAM-dependent methyltransferase [Prochlorococcus marinus]|uniref:class I SAM-dependent methyltransferase n=1 Tax=Prochlorococcus marinus TaxID=1219 RepID=UPI001ADC5654|nr:class I SAM-dependent methyltransferase [Prochlorococcus marinus]MBO8204965.1 class I SAM-dependent methyltransferase [Prochlorococcus marinus CUG1415]MBW3044238.1 hypothetical protein [Prochlorococcus marinus str. MU1415]